MRTILHKPCSRWGTSRFGLLVVLVLLSGAVAAGGWAMNNYLWAAPENGMQNAVMAEVTRGRFVHLVTEQGELESAQNVDVRCEVEIRGASTVVIDWIIPEGTYVKEGDKLIEFNDTTLREQETQQRILYEQARASAIQAELAYETAQIAVDEYLNGTFQQELQLLESEIVVAEEDLRRAEDYARYSEKLAQKGYVTSVQLEADKFAVKNARITLETAQLKKKVLKEYTKAKMLKQLESEVGTAEAQMLAQKASFKLEEEELKELQRQIELCIAYAPSDGQVVYAHETDRRGNIETLIDQGLAVREEQVVIRLPDPKQMQVKARIKEGRISLVEVGQPAEISVDAMPGQVFSGTVEKVDAIALPSYYSSVKEYATVISIDNPPENLKPGMTAAVSILVNERDDATMVPVQCITERAKRYFVGLNTAGGPIAREVKIGPNNEKFVVVESGLDGITEVVMDPDRFLADLLPEEELPEPGLKRSRRSKGSSPSDSSSEESKSEQSQPASFLTQLDKNKDGKISRDEAPERMKEHFQKIDKNNDGMLDADELAALAQMRKQAESGKGRPNRPSDRGT